MSTMIEQTRERYARLMEILQNLGCTVYETGSALIPGVEPNDMDIVCAFPDRATEVDAMVIMEEYGFSQLAENFDAKRYEIPDHGLWYAPGEEHMSYERCILPAHIIFLDADSEEAAAWRVSTDLLHANPLDYIDRQERVRMFRILRGQRVEHD